MRTKTDRSFKGLSLSSSEDTAASTASNVGTPESRGRTARAKVKAKSKTSAAEVDAVPFDPVVDLVAAAPAAPIPAHNANTNAGVAHEAALAPLPFTGGPAAGSETLPGGGVVYMAAINVGPDDLQGDGRSFGVGGIFRAVFKGVIDIVRLFVLLLKYPFMILLALYIVLLAFGCVLDTATESLAPVCTFFPSRVSQAADALTASLGNVGRKARAGSEDLRRIDFPGLMDLQSRTLDQLLSHSTAGSELALGIRHAELAVRDLGVIVKVSNLTSKHILAHALQEFSQDARDAGRDLQHLSAKLYGAVDKYVHLMLMS